MVALLLTASSPAFFVAEVKLRAKVRYFGELSKLTNANNV